MLQAEFLNVRKLLKREAGIGGAASEGPEGFVTGPSA